MPPLRKIETSQVNCEVKSYSRGNTKAASGINHRGLIGEGELRASRHSPARAALWGEWGACSCSGALHC